MTRYEQNWSVPFFKQYDYTQVDEYTTGTISPLAFPNVAIALDKLLLY